MVKRILGKEFFLSSIKTLGGDAIFGAQSFIKIHVMGLGQKILTQVGSDQPSMVWVWIWKISNKNVKFFNFFPLDQINIFGSGQKVPGSKVGGHLNYCGSKVCLGLRFMG